MAMLPAISGASERISQHPMRKHAGAQRKIGEVPRANYAA
jgi:hypothetical protein